MSYSSFGAIFFQFCTPFFDFGPFLKGYSQPIEKKQLHFQMQNFMLNFMKKKLFENVHYSRSLPGPENCWCVLAQFEKLGLNCPLGPTQRVNTNSHIAYNRSIHPVSGSIIFNFWVFPVVNFTRKILLLFWGFGTQLDPIFRVWGQKLQ